MYRSVREDRTVPINVQYFPFAEYTFLPLCISYFWLNNLNSIIMPKPKYILNVDGKEQPVSVDNIKRYGIDSYAQEYGKERSAL